MARGGLDPKTTHNIIFGDNGPTIPRGGKSALSAEEGLIRNIPKRIGSGNGIEAFGTKLPEALAAGQIVNQMHRQIAHASIRGTVARAAIKRHRG